MDFSWFWSFELWSIWYIKESVLCEICCFIYKYQSLSTILFILKQNIRQANEATQKSSTSTMIDDFLIDGAIFSILESLLLYHWLAPFINIIKPSRCDFHSQNAFFGLETSNNLPQKSDFWNPLRCVFPPAVALLTMLWCHIACWVNKTKILYFTSDQPNCSLQQENNQNLEKST